LFPNINHCHLPALAPAVKELCHRHNVPYHHVSGYRDAVRTHFAHTATMAKKPE
jgi:delta11-fatty-acid desaturase